MLKSVFVCGLRQLAGLSCLAAILAGSGGIALALAGVLG
jgi:hypothetical protein